MKTYQLPKGSRLLGANEVPQPGDFSKWSESKRDQWTEIGRGNTFLHSLPVATIRNRVGQDSLQFATFRKD